VELIAILVLCCVALLCSFASLALSIIILVKVNTVPVEAPAPPLDLEAFSKALSGDDDMFGGFEKMQQNEKSDIAPEDTV